VSSETENVGLVPGNISHAIFVGIGLEKAADTIDF